MANKSKLNELVHKQSLQLPEYDTLAQGDGFICKLKLGEEIFVSEKVHSRKKAAEDDAAAVAVLHFTTRNSKIIDKVSQPIASTDSLTEKEGQSPPEQESIQSRSTSIDNKNKTGNTKEIPLNMFYPVSQLKIENKPSEELQDFCSSRGWTEPIYHLKVKSKASTCGVFVNKVLYSFNETYPSDEEAKQEAAKRVLATLSAKPAEELEKTRQGITVIVPASKRSHPASAKLVETTSVPTKHTPAAASTTKHIPAASTPIASAEEITLAISKLTIPTSSDINDIDDRNTTTKQPVTTSGTESKATEDKSTDAKYSGGDKNTLQHLCQKRGMIPEYATEYPPHEVGYISKVTVDGKTFSSDVHSSKKAAEAAAARVAIDYLTTNFSESTTGNSAMPNLLDMAVSYKNLLQEYLQKQKLPLPTFRTMASAEMSGFVSTVSIKSADGMSTTYKSSPHPSKKAAEQNAAAIACQSLNLTA